MRWKVASDLRFWAVISEPKTLLSSFCGISGDLAPSARKSLAIAIMRFWCAKVIAESLALTEARAAKAPSDHRKPRKPFRFKGLFCTFRVPHCNQGSYQNLTVLVAQCSATPATVAATPPCSATPFQTQISVRHLPAQGGRCDTKTFRGCSATPVLHLQNALKSRKSAATRVARHV